MQGSGPATTPGASEQTAGDFAGLPAARSARDRTGIWKAVAGMAVALALAGAIVSLDISRELIHRTHYMGHRIALLRKDVSRLEGELALNRARLAQARKQFSEQGRILRVLIAPDVASFTMAGSPPASKASAILSVSHEMSGAVLIARGLEKPASGQSYQAWWVSKGAPSAKAAEFSPLANGTATVYLGAPPQNAHKVECVVAVGNAGEDSASVTGHAVLKARLAR